MIIYSFRIIGVLGKESPLIKKRGGLKVNTARDEWKKILAESLRRTKQVY